MGNANKDVIDGHFSAEQWDQVTEYKHCHIVL